MSLSRTFRCAALLTLASAALSVHASGPNPKLVADDDEFQVNTYTTGSQRFPAVAVHDNGFVVVWDSVGSSGTDTDQESIQGQRLDRTGQPVGGQFQINTYTTGGQKKPEVSTWPDGRFVVFWDLGSTMRGRVFGSDGSPQFEEFSVPATTFRPQVEVGGDGFLVAWSESGGVDEEIFAQLFDSTGTALGSSVQVNTQTAGSQGLPSIRSTPSGGFRLVWQSETSAGDDPMDSIQTRELAADGTPLASDFQVNSYTTGFAFQGSIDFADDGSFVVAFGNYGSPGDDDVYGAILARSFDSAGSPIGPELQVNSYTPGYSQRPDIAVGPQGDFVVVWSGNAAGASTVFDYSAVVDRFDSSGTRIGTEFTANSYTSISVYATSLARLDSGDFLVVWESDVAVGDDTDATSIQARLFRTEADVAVTKSDGVDTATPGGSVTYTIAVSNAGPDAATNVALSDALPAALDCTFTSVAAGGATGNTTAGAGDLDETLFLPIGADVTYTLDCDVDPDARGELVNQVSVTADQVDDDASNDQATDTDTLVPSTDLSVEMDFDAQNVAAGETRTVRVTVANDGPSSSFGSTVLDVLPAELTFSSSPDCAENMGVVVCSVPALEPGEQATIEYEVLVDPAATTGTEILVDAVVTTSDTDPDASNDTDASTWTVVEPEIFADGFETGDFTGWTSSVP